jgi:hypothetical protein
MPVHSILSASREEGTSQTFRCKTQVVLAECGKCKNELHVTGAVGLGRCRPVEPLDPDPGIKRAVEGILLGQLDLEIGDEVHACIVSIDGDFAPKVFFQRFDEHGAPVAIDDPHLSNIGFEMPLGEEVCEDLLVDGGALKVAEQLGCGKQVLEAGRHDEVAQSQGGE